MSNYLTGDESGLTACWSPDVRSGERIQDLVSENHGRLEIGSGDKLDCKWVEAPLPADVRANWVARDDPEEKWVAPAPIAILDFGVSRDGTLALIGELEDRSEITLALNGAGGAATLPIPVLDADATGADAKKVTGRMRSVAVDKKGLTVSAGVLNFAHSGDTPLLLDGADGLIHLYFRGDYGMFLVAQHDTLTARAKYSLPLDGTGATDEGQRLHFTARRTGTQMEGYEIAIADGSDGDRCQATIDNQNGIREAWQDVPRDLESFLAVLNGAATNDANDPLVQEGELLFYDYVSHVQREGVPDLTSTDNPFFGSTLFAVGADNLPDNGVPITVRNVDIAEVARQPGRDCAWIPEPQGKALQFDGVDDYVELPKDKLTIAGDLTMEAWVNVADGTGADDSLRIVDYHRSEDSKCTLGLTRDRESNGDEDEILYKVFAGTWNQAVQTKDATVSPGEWTHLAAVYNATNALQLDGGGYVDCGNDATLDMTEALTVEAWVTPERTGRSEREIVLSKWGAAAQDQSWQLYIDTDGKPCFETLDHNRRVIRVKSSVRLEAGRAYHLAGVFAASPKKEVALSLDEKSDHVSIPNADAIDFGREDDLRLRRGSSQRHNNKTLRIQTTPSLKNGPARAATRT